MKTCTKCGKTKDISFFEKNRRQCKACRKQQRLKVSHSVSVTEKECAHCHEVKAANEFYENKSHRSGLGSYCKSCIQDRTKQQIYGISKKEYNEMLDYQGGVCAICGLKESVKEYTTGKVRRLAVDHDHRTGKVRSLLCGRCNIILGHVDDSPELLRKMVDYLDICKEEQ